MQITWYILHKGSDLGKYNILKCDIQLTNHQPLKKRYKSITLHLFQEVKQYQMTEIGTIRKSVSPWANAIVLVRKKDGEPDFVLTYLSVMLCWWYNSNSSYINNNNLYSVYTVTNSIARNGPVMNNYHLLWDDVISDGVVSKLTSMCWCRALYTVKLTCNFFSLLLMGLYPCYK